MTLKMFITALIMEAEEDSSSVKSIQLIRLKPSRIVKESILDRNLVPKWITLLLQKVGFRWIHN